MDLPIWGTWGMPEHNVLFGSMVTVVTPCWEFKAQKGLISSHFVDTLLLIVPHGHMCKCLGIGEEFIFKRKILLMPENFLAFWGLNGFSSRLISFF